MNKRTFFVRIFINTTAIFFVLLFIYLMWFDILGNQDAKVILNFNSLDEFWIEFIILNIFFVFLIFLIKFDIKKGFEECE